MIVQKNSSLISTLVLHSSSSNLTESVSRDRRQLWPVPIQHLGSRKAETEASEGRPRWDTVSRDNPHAAVARSAALWHR